MRLHHVPNEILNTFLVLCISKHIEMNCVILCYNYDVKFIEFQKICNIQTFTTNKQNCIFFTIHKQFIMRQNEVFRTRLVSFFFQKCGNKLLVIIVIHCFLTFGINIIIHLKFVSVEKFLGDKKFCFLIN